MQVTARSIMALDVGERRIGVALAGSVAKLARPLTTLTHTTKIYEDIIQIIELEAVDRVIVGLPRGLDGQTTAQTKSVYDFVAKLKDVLDIPVILQDEALTSVKAKDELKKRGKAIDKGDVDSLAATFILEDYLHEQEEAKDV
jgi:putative Holliday junction resolvase